jgi:hypothetical protein
MEAGAPGQFIAGAADRTIVLADIGPFQNAKLIRYDAMSSAVLEATKITGHSSNSPTR